MSELLASISTIDELLQRIPDTPERLDGLFKYLQASERLLLDVIADVNEGILPRPVNPEVEGELEFGLFLYWLNNLDEAFEAAIRQEPASNTALMALRHFAPQYEYNMTEEIFGAFQKSAYDYGIVAADGTLWTLGKYAQLDLGWLTTLPHYAKNLLDPSSIYHPYPTPDKAYKAAIGAGQDSVSIAIIGDWGCGAYGDEFGGHGPAVAVMNAVKDLNVDYVVHLGDVYYCGTDANRFPPNEEQNKLLDTWDTGLTEGGRSFTINSNHEMYGAAKGLIDVALAPGTPFGHQNTAPYFALTYNDWVIIGLDSAYFDPSMLYMKGAINDPQQQKFVNSLGDLSDKKVLTMTHHNPMIYDGSAITKHKRTKKTLWGDMKALLGKQPDVWYWGHLHLGVVYNEHSVLGAPQGKTGATTTCRCVGHSAMPYGNAHGMVPKNVHYYANTPLTKGSKQMQNGFAVLTLNSDGSFAETFYEVTSNGDYVVGWKSP